MIGPCPPVALLACCPSAVRAFLASGVSRSWPETTSWVSDGAPGKDVSMALSAWTTGRSWGRSATCRSPVLHRGERDGQGTEDADSGQEEPERVVGDDAGEPGPEAVRPAGSRGALLASGAGRGAAAVARDAATVDAVAEKGEHRGQHGERAEHGDRDDRDGAQADRDEVAGAGDQQAGQGDHHGESRDEDRPAHGGGCRRSTRTRAWPDRQRVPDHGPGGAPHARGVRRTGSSRRRRRDR